MEIVVKGEGEMMFALIDRQGRNLMQEKLIVSGSSSIQARANIALVLETTEGELALAPVLLARSNPDQKITFDGQGPQMFFRRRCKDIGGSSKLIKDVERGHVQPVSQNQMTFPADDIQDLQTMLKSMKSVKK